METADMSELQKVADYYSMKKSLKRKGVVHIIFGIIGIIFGLLYTLAWHPVNAIVVLIAIFVLFTGIWALVVSKRSSLLIAGIALCFMVAWNLVVTLINLAIFIMDFPSGPVWSVFGFVWVSILFGLAIDAFGKYRRFSSVPEDKPSKEMLKNVVDIIKPVIKANFQKEEDIIQFQVRDAWAGNKWRGRLAGSYVILTSPSGDDIRFVRPENFEMTIGGKVGLTKKRKASFTIEGHKYSAIIAPGSLKRYELWKQSAG